jgi:hypothetical protein
MPAVGFADGDQVARRLAGLEDDDHLIGLRPPEVGIDEGLRRSSAGASTIGTPHWAARAVTQCWYWVAISRSTALLTG